MTMKFTTKIATLTLIGSYPAACLKKYKQLESNGHTTQLCTKASTLMQACSHYRGVQVGTDITISLNKLMVC